MMCNRCSLRYPPSLTSFHGDQIRVWSKPSNNCVFLFHRFKLSWKLVSRLEASVGLGKVYLNAWRWKTQAARHWESLIMTTSYDYNYWPLVLDPRRMKSSSFIPFTSTSYCISSDLLKRQDPSAVPPSPFLFSPFSFIHPKSLQKDLGFHQW